MEVLMVDCVLYGAVMKLLVCRIRSSDFYEFYESQRSVVNVPLGHVRLMSSCLSKCRGHRSQASSSFYAKVGPKSWQFVTQMKSLASRSCSSKTHDFIRLEVISE